LISPALLTYSAKISRKLSDFMADESQFDWLKFLLGFVRATRWAIILGLGFLAGVFALYFLIDSPLVNSVQLKQYTIFQFVVNLAEPVVIGIKSVIKANTKFHDYELLPLIVATVIYFSMRFVKFQGIRVVAMLQTKVKIRQLKSSRTKTLSADGLTFSSTTADKAGRGLFKGIAFKQEDERDKLLRELAKVKKRLEKTKQKLAFLSVDIVGSTRMKVGQDPLILEHLFREYRGMLEGIFKKYRYRTASWTPDGVMACFPQVNLACAAAKELLKKLPVFNKEKNRIGFPIQVRCGLNAGEVNYDESTPLELLSSRVLDITGHLQKAAMPDSIFVTEEIYKELRDKNGHLLCPDEVDGYKVYQWSLGVPQSMSDTK
jgi:class 3 adenylate cyclase